jgi:hypothetical protein
MCTVVLSIESGLPVLLAGIRDELTDRPWEAPGWHWPDYDGLIGGRDLLAGGTWLAVAPADRLVACVLNGRGQPAPAASRRSRGVLPLKAASARPLDHSALPGLDPFHLLIARPGRALMRSWDGRELRDRELPPGLHFVVNSGVVNSGVVNSGVVNSGVVNSGVVNSGVVNSGVVDAGDPDTAGVPHELARAAHFVPRFAAATRPDPQPGEPVAGAWGDWLPLLDGDGLDPADPAALIVRRDLADGRTWGSTSISLVALAPGLVRYDFTGRPGDRSAWYSVL